MTPSPVSSRSTEGSSAKQTEATARRKAEVEDEARSDEDAKQTARRAEPGKGEQVDAHA